MKNGEMLFCKSDRSDRVLIAIGIAERVGASNKFGAAGTLNYSHLKRQL